MEKSGNNPIIELMQRRKFLEAVIAQLNSLTNFQRARGLSLDATNSLFQVLYSVCQKHYLPHKAEYRLNIYRNVYRDIGLRKWQGIADFHVRLSFDDLCTIEIDRSNKKWSLKKLEYAASIGHFPLWIRWKGKELIEVPPNICVIDFRTDKIAVINRPNP